MAPALLVLTSDLLPPQDRLLPEERAHRLNQAVEAAKPMDATLPSRGFPRPDARDWSPTNLKAAALRGASKSKSSASLYTTFEEIDEYDRLQKKAVRELMRRKVGRMQKEEALNPVPPTFSAKTAKSFLSDPPSFLLSDDAQQSRRLS